MIITIANIRGLAGTSLAFKRKLWGISQLVQTAVDNVATAIGFETGGTFSPAIPNKAGSGAMGLIQFMPSTAANLLGWSNTPENRVAARARFAAMTDVAQLDYVARYLLWFGKGKLVTLEDTYMSILWPAGIGKPNDYVLFPKGTVAYEQNKGFDRNGDGVTKAEVCQSIRSLYESAQGRIEVEVEGVPVPNIAPHEESPVHEFTPDEVMARVALSLDQQTAEALDRDHRDARDAAFGDPPTRDDLRPIAMGSTDHNDRDELEAIQSRETLPPPPGFDDPPPTERNS